MVTRARKANKGKKGKDTGKAKHKGKHESSLKFEACCGHCVKCGHKRCRCKNTVAEVDEEESVERQNSSAAAARVASRLHLPVCFLLEPRSVPPGRSPH